MFIHNFPLFPCSWDAGDDNTPAKTLTGVYRTDSTHVLLMGGQAKSLRRGVPTRQGPADLGHRYVRKRYLGQEGLNLLAGSGSHMRLSQESSREMPLRSLSLPQLEGNRYCLKVLNITLNQQLAGAVTSPGSVAHLI